MAHRPPQTTVVPNRYPRQIVTRQQGYEIVILCISPTREVPKVALLFAFVSLFRTAFRRHDTLSISASSRSWRFDGPKEMTL
jgi:hypothetical protein